MRGKKKSYRENWASNSIFNRMNLSKRSKCSVNKCFMTFMNRKVPVIFTHYRLNKSTFKWEVKKKSNREKKQSFSFLFVNFISKKGLYCGIKYLISFLNWPFSSNYVLFEVWNQYLIVCFFQFLILWMGEWYDFSF